MSRKWSTRRKSLAIGLAVVGVAGLSLASASQLGLNWNSAVYQSGQTVAVDAVCQSGAVQAAYDAPVFTPAASGSPWVVSQVKFTGVDPKCAGKTVEVSYKVSATGQWQTDAVPTSAKVSGTSITVPIPSTASSDTITNWALTIHD